MFSTEFIEQTRVAQGDEAAQQLTEANSKEAGVARIQGYKTSQAFAEKHPRMVVAVKAGKFDQTVFPTDEAAAAFFAQQEAFLAEMGTPIPGQQPAPATPGGTTFATPITTMAPAKLGVKPGVIPWDQGATDAMTMAPISPGPAPGEELELVAAIEDMMEPEEGQFRNARARDFKLIRNMEAANRVEGGTQAMREMRRGHEDPDAFPLS